MWAATPRSRWPTCARSWKRCASPTFDRSCNPGNLVLSHERAEPADIEHLLENEAAERLGLQTDFFVRTAAEWDDVIAHDPFPDVAERDPGHLVVMFLKEAPAVTAGEALRAAIRGPELIHARGREAYITYPDGIGRSRVTTALIESKLGTRSTGRNWNTVLKLADLVNS